MRSRKEEERIRGRRKKRKERERREERKCRENCNEDEERRGRRKMKYVQLVDFTPEKIVMMEQHFKCYVTIFLHACAFQFKIEDCLCSLLSTGHIIRMKQRQERVWGVGVGGERWPLGVYKSLNDSPILCVISCVILAPSNCPEVEVELW